jgi:hypothetical protein
MSAGFNTEQAVLMGFVRSQAEGYDQGSGRCGLGAGYCALAVVSTRWVLASSKASFRYG